MSRFKFAIPILFFVPLWILPVLGQQLATVSELWKIRFRVDPFELGIDLNRDGMFAHQKAMFGTASDDASSITRTFSGNGLVFWFPGVRYQRQASAALALWQELTYGRTLIASAGINGHGRCRYSASHYYRIKALPSLDSDVDGLSDLDGGFAH